MFGVYRTFLALAVIVHHLLAIPLLGHYAVHGFFILSGYLMTLIMANSYGHSPRGIGAFATNRFLRLFPAYWVILIISILIFLWVGDKNVQGFRFVMGLPDSFFLWLQNLSLVYANVKPSLVQPRIAPPTWALTVELFYYFLIAVGVSKSKKTTVAWLSISVIYMLGTYIAGLNYDHRYATLPAGSLPFSIGATIFHYKDKFALVQEKLSTTSSVIGLYVLFLSNVGACILVQRFTANSLIGEISYFLNYILNAGLIIALIPGRVSIVSNNWDKFIGDFSYPIYLAHWQLALLASMLIFGEPLNGLNLNGLIVFIATLILCGILSLGLIYFVDRPIEKIRQRIKRRRITAQETKFVQPTQSSRTAESI